MAALLLILLVLLLDSLVCWYCQRHLPPRL